MTIIFDQQQRRDNWIEQQLRPAHVLDEKTLRILSEVKREDFVPLAYRHLAFADTEIPLAESENMLTPILEARMLQALKLSKHAKVLEIGSGSGYMAALLAQMAQNVISVEIKPSLHQFAKTNLTRADIKNVELVLGDGSEAWPNKSSDASYDAIVISGALPKLPEIFKQQIKIGGKIIAILGQAPAMEVQLIERVQGAHYLTHTLFETCTQMLQLKKSFHPFEF